MSQVKFTKVGSNYSHTSGVTIVKVSPAMTRYAVLVPGKAIQYFGSFQSAKSAATTEVRTLAA